MWEKIPDTHFISWPRISDSFYKGEFGIVDDMLETDLLFLDDLGAERDPKLLAQDKLCQVLSKRERKHTVVTTNIQPQHWIERWEERIADRLLRNSVVIDLTEVPSFAVMSA